MKNFDPEYVSASYRLEVDTKTLPEDDIRITKEIRNIAKGYLAEDDIRVYSEEEDRLENLTGNRARNLMINGIGFLIGIFDAQVGGNGSVSDQENADAGGNPDGNFTCAVGNDRYFGGVCRSASDSGCGVYRVLAVVSVERSSFYHDFNDRGSICRLSRFGAQDPE